jgi:hypothetical protein
MQQALENPHFKKVWEEINWKIRHPEAKSLEEALKFEREEPLSLLVAYSSWPREQTFTSVEYDIRDYYNGMARVERVLGRPITLEDILQIQVNPQSVIFAGGWLKEYIKQARLVYDNGMILLGLPSRSTYINLDDAIHNNDFCIDWRLTKPLHEQSPETWEKIANLI